MYFSLINTLINPIIFLLSFLLFKPHQQAGLHPHSQQNQNPLHNQASYSNPSSLPPTLPSNSSQTITRPHFPHPNTNFPVSNQITTNVQVPKTTLTSSPFQNNTLPPPPHLHPIPEVSSFQNFPQELVLFGSGTSSSEQSKSTSSSSSSSLSPICQFRPCYPVLKTAQRPVTEPDTTLRLGVSPDVRSTTLRLGVRPEIPSTQTTPLQSTMPATSSTSNDNTQRNQNVLHNQPSYSNPPNTNSPVSSQITTHVRVPETTLTSPSFQNNTLRLPPYPHPIYDIFINQSLYYAPFYPMSSLLASNFGDQGPILEGSENLRLGVRPELPSTQTTPRQSTMPTISSTSNDNTRTENTSTSNIGQLNINMNHRFLINLPIINLKISVYLILILFLISYFWFGTGTKQREDTSDNDHTTKKSERPYKLPDLN